MQKILQRSVPPISTVILNRFMQHILQSDVGAKKIISSAALIVETLLNRMRNFASSIFKFKVEMSKSNFKQIKQILQSLTSDDQQIVGLEQLMSNTRSSRVFCAA